MFRDHSKLNFKSLHGIEEDPRVNFHKPWALEMSNIAGIH